MQTLEALISLFIFMAFLSFVTLEWQTPNQVDTSLYKFQLVNDVWRVLYLRGDFTDFSFDNTNIARAKAESDVHTIGELTSHCIFVGGERITNCRGVGTEHIITTERIGVVDGNPQSVTITLATK